MKRMISFAIFNMLIAYAYGIRIEYGDNILIDKPVYEDLYLFGNNITVNAPVYGDIVCAGGTIFFMDTIDQDLLVAGGKVTINGYVSDDIRCIGGELLLNNTINGDLIIGGGKITINKSATIAGALIMTGGDMVFEGQVNENARIYAGQCLFNGRAARDFEFKGESLKFNGIVDGKSIISAQTLVLGELAVFNNQVRYYVSGAKVNFDKALKNGSADFDASLKFNEDKWYFLGGVSIFTLIWYIGVAILLILILQYVFGRQISIAAHGINDSVWKSLGAGLLFIIGIPVLVILTMVTIIGVPLGLIVGINYLVIILIASIISSLVYGHWLAHRINVEITYKNLVLISMGVFIFIKLISITKGIGWLLNLILISIAFGSILLHIRLKKSPVEDDGMPKPTMLSQV